MASFSIAGSQEDLTSEDDLWAVLKGLIGQGWRGTVSAAPSGDVAVWSLDAHIDDPVAMNGTRSIRASVGDKKVVIGGVVTVMTQEAFTATYGAP